MGVSATPHRLVAAGRGYRPDMTDSHHDTAPDDTTSHVTASVAEVDAEVRAKLTGQSVSSIATQAEDAFATIGVQLDGEQLAAYADAVSTGSAFAIELVTEG